MSAPARWFAARSIIARLDVPAYWRELAYRERVLRWVEQGIGGFCLFGGTPEEVARVALEVQAAASVPLVLAADLEYGLPMRFAGGTAFPRAFALARAGRPEWTAAVARVIARQARQLGIGWNFAPVCDVTTNPANPVIGIRAFGQTPQEASVHIRAWIEATQNEGVGACAKHFPGHGDVTVDSHEALPTVTADRATLWERELQPFREALAAGVVGVMVGHLRVPALGIEELPASLSPRTTALLREELGYDGLVLTDALDMGAIVQHWTTAQAVEYALRAGVDILLMPADVEEALAAAEHLLNTQPELIEQRRRSLARWRWLRTDPPFPEQSGLEETLADVRLALQVAQAAVEISGNTSLVPLPADAHVLFLACLPEETLMGQATFFFRLIAQQTRLCCDMAYVSPGVTPEEEQRLYDTAAGATHAVVLLLVPPRGSQRGLPRWYGMLARCAERMPTVVVLAGNPFVPLPGSVATVVRTYSDTEPSLAAAALLLSGTPLEREQAEETS